MSLSAFTFRIHRWLGWLVGIQVLLWVLGGVVFALLPFKAWVKGGDSVSPPVLSVPPGWSERLAPQLLAAEAQGPVAAMQAVATPQGPVLRLSRAAGGDSLLLPLDGSAWSAPDAAAVQRFAQSMYRGSGSVSAVERIDHPPRRLGLVDETAGRRGLWRVSFDDGLRTRIYLDGRSGEYVLTRNEAWVWYDFFWRLHIMDYAGSDDFNSTLLRAAALSALPLSLAGVVLAVLALRRRWRVWRKA